MRKSLKFNKKHSEKVDFTKKKLDQMMDFWVHHLVHFFENEGGPNDGPPTVT